MDRLHNVQTTSVTIASQLLLQFNDASDKDANVKVHDLARDGVGQIAILIARGNLYRIIVDFPAFLDERAEFVNLRLAVLRGCALTMSLTVAKHLSISFILSGSHQSSRMAIRMIWLNRSLLMAKFSAPAQYWSPRWPSYAPLSSSIRS
jgi:hypothetical protein